jgi:hypothetical protein
VALDCRVASLLAMTIERHDVAFSRRDLRPSFASTPPSKIRGRREGRVAAAPGAPAQREIARARKPQAQPVITPAFPARWFYGLYALSPVNHPVCHRRRRNAQASSATWRQGLGAPGPHDFAVRVVAARQQARPRPPHPRLTCRDVRETPLRRSRRDDARKC